VSVNDSLRYQRVLSTLFVCWMISCQHGLGVGPQQNTYLRFSSAQERYQYFGNTDRQSNNVDHEIMFPSKMIYTRTCYDEKGQVHSALIQYPPRGTRQTASHIFYSSVPVRELHDTTGMYSGYLSHDNPGIWAREASSLSRT
jgi:hypothetical protein